MANERPKVSSALGTAGILQSDWQRELTRARTRTRRVGAEFYTVVAKIASSGISQVEIAKHLHTSQPQVSRWAARGRNLLNASAEVGSGTRYHLARRYLRGESTVHREAEVLSVSPYDMAERYSRGEISRAEVISALTDWRYVQAETHTGGLHEDVLNYVPGSFDDVQAAALDDLIDDEIYAAALDALKAQTTNLNTSDE